MANGPPAEPQGDLAALRGIKEKEHGIGKPIIETSRVLPQTSSATIVSSISWCSLLPSENRR
jgi:hypothetical protein